MKNGYIEPQDAETLMDIYKKIDAYGNLNESLTIQEHVLIFCIAKSIIDGKTIANKEDKE